MRGGGLRLRRRVGEDHVGLPVDGLEARRLALAGCRHLLGQVENVVGVRRSARPAARRFAASIASTSCCRMADAAAARAAATAAPDGAAAAAAGRGGGAAGGRLGGGGLAVSSSAMMRRMEARISSIDGSCAFAGWLIAESLQPIPTHADAGRIRRAAANHPHTRYLLGSPQVWHGDARTQTQPCGYAHVRAPRRQPANGVNYFPSGVRTPDPGVAHLMVVHLRVVDRHRRAPAPAATAVPTAASSA